MPIKMSAISEITDLQCDACIIDPHCNLVFLSLWARDTSLQELFARLTLGKKDTVYGLDCINLVEYTKVSIGIDDIERYSKCSTRTYKRTLFGNLLNSWIFDKRCIQPDKANHSAILILEQDKYSDDELNQQFWSIIKDICPLPLLDHWQHKVFPIIRENNMLIEFKTLVGCLSAWQLKLDIEVLEAILSELIQTNQFCVSKSITHKYIDPETKKTYTKVTHSACCPDCMTSLLNDDGEPMTIEEFKRVDRRINGSSCYSPLWTLMRQNGGDALDMRTKMRKSLCQIPTIGPVKSEQIIDKFGEEFIAGMLADNIHEFINLMDEKGNLFFTDSQATRMERAMAKIEFEFGEGGYQPTEFIKRYLPQGFFDLLIVDEGYEYKNQSSAQGLAMGVLAVKVRKVLLLTGTLMGGYADDLFYLLFRILTSRMIEDGYRPSERGSLGVAAMSFLRDYGVLKDIYTEKNSGSHKTAKGTKLTRRTVKAPGFGPKGIHRYILPFTVFLKLKGIGGNVLPGYQEEFIEISMTPEQEYQYSRLASLLTSELRRALARRDTTLLGVVLNTLLAWPDCCFRRELVTHPRDRSHVLAMVPSQFEAHEIMPKEKELIQRCLQEKAEDRKVLVYTTYTGTRDTMSRLKTHMEQAGLNVAVLRSTVSTDKREDWILDKVDKGIDVLITNPELVKTGLDLLDFPTIVFLQTGFNVYTLLQASRRSWRIGQTNDVKVIFLGYQNTSQIDCLKLMAKKIAVSQSTSGDMPDSGLDVLNSEEDSIEMALAKQLIGA